MKVITILSIFYLIIENLIADPCSSANSNNLIFKSLNGKLKGSCNTVKIKFSNNTQSENPILQWLGIPYAQTPVGDLRFKSPLPVKSWSNVKEVKNFNYMCIQPPGSEYPREWQNEDCLYLNIYKPFYNSNSSNNNLLPIYIWIHGGAFSMGSGSEVDGSKLAALSNIIVVTINYRLGIYGFLSIKNTDAKGNQALLDQNLAMKWVFDNAASFGGDKTKITIGGESAGSWSVGYHLIFKKSWPYFRNAILQSGNPTTVDLETMLLTSDQATKLTSKMASNVGCNKKVNQDLLNCLKSKNTDKINQVASKLYDYPSFTLDPNVFDQLPRNLFKSGNFKKCNVLTGSNTNEEGMLLDGEISQYVADLEKGIKSSFINALKKRLLINDTIANQIANAYVPYSLTGTINYINYFEQIITDYQYRCPTNNLADYISKNNKDAYIYIYGHKSSDSPSNYDIYDGAVHADEIAYVFGEPLASVSKYTLDEKNFSLKLVQYWTSFIINGTPTLDNSWLKYNANTNTNNKNINFLESNNISNIIYSTSDPKCTFWNNLNIQTVITAA
jgi:carboxylesterase type B